MTRGARRIGLLGGGLLVLGAAVGAVTLGRPSRGGADVRIIAHGEEVDLAAHHVPGKYTVFDFYAPWCPPCRVLGPALERLAAKRPADLAIRKIDIVDWTMPVAAQHGIESLPHLVLYDRDGRKVADGDDVYDALTRVFGDAAREVNEVMGLPPEGPGAVSKGS
jgi:thiol-disulfide isomerase/thioredoxin